MGASLGGERGHRVAGEEGGDAEVNDDGVAATVDQDVGGLEVAVDDAVLVEALNGVGDGGEAGDALAQGEGDAGGAIADGHAAELVQRHALDVLGDDVEPALVQAVVDEAGDDGEAELGEQVEFAPRAAGAPPGRLNDLPH